MKPIVSICCMTYNHVNFIKDCIEGFIKQKTDFDYEILIHDDASTDDNAKIIHNYEIKYPELIKVVYQKENQFLKQNALFNILFPMARGKYITICEGDDYWTDPNKLQKQVAFLERNKSCNYVFTNNSILTSNGELKTDDKNLDDVFDLNYLLDKRIMPTTLTLMFKKKSIINKTNWRSLMSKTFNGDWVLLFMLNQNSKIGFIKDNTGVYRQGIGIVSNTNLIYKMKNGIETNKKLNKMTNFKYNKYLNDNRFNYSQISYHYAREKKIIRFLIWFVKIQFHLIKFHGFSLIFRDWNKRFIKNNINIFLNRTKK